MVKKMIKKWDGVEEWEIGYPNGIAWSKTGKHKCQFIIGDSMGDKNRNRCMICGTYKKDSKVK